MRHLRCVALLCFVACSGEETGPMEGGPDSPATDPFLDPMNRGCRNALGVISSEWTHACAILADRTLRCWGSDDAGEAQPPAGEFLQVDTAAEMSCAVRIDGTLACWGDDSGMVISEVPEGTYQTVEIGLAQACAIDAAGALRCWGWAANRQPLSAAGPFVQLSMGGYGTCAVRADQSVQCWTLGNEDFAFLEGPLQQVSMGYVGGCGLRPNGSTLCASSGFVNAYASKFRQLSTNGNYVCGVTADRGELQCTNIATGELDFGVPFGSFTEVSVGNGLICAAGADGSPVCFNTASENAAPKQRLLQLDADGEPCD